MKLHVVHRTVFRYAGAVTQNLNEVRLKPVSFGGQVCESFQLKTQPVSSRSSYLDFYYNYVEFFEIPGPHSELIVEGSSITTTQQNTLSCDVETSPMSELAATQQLDRCYDFIQPSTLVSLPPEVWRLALDATHGQTDIWQAALSAMRFIHANVKYEQNATNVHTPVLEVIKLKKGVCQDFAHLLLGMCRTLKIPARYVSGYLYNGNADQLLGTQASHAWCEVYLPQLGWQGLDPTNNQAVDARYVKIAVGRDYLDAAPIKGHFRGPPGCEMRVELEVKEWFL